MQNAKLRVASLRLYPYECFIRFCRYAAETQMIIISFPLGPLALGP